ncbi:MAG: hypothetical protein MK179_17495 [Pirellulaceae bacterium]|nr:hypothetical protein [Pirellulaceae bacterium]
MRSNRQQNRVVRGSQLRLTELPGLPSLLGCGLDAGKDGLHCAGTFSSQAQAWLPRVQPNGKLDNEVGSS